MDKQSHQPCCIQLAILSLTDEALIVNNLIKKIIGFHTGQQFCRFHEMICKLESHVEFEVLTADILIQDVTS
jgi:hypothetical protein